MSEDRSDGNDIGTETNRNLSALIDRSVITGVRAGQVAIGILPRAELWAMFAAAAMGVGDPAENTALAARAADRMLDEFLKRFPAPEQA